MIERSGEVERRLQKAADLACRPPLQVHHRPPQQLAQLQLHAVALGPGGQRSDQRQTLAQVGYRFYQDEALQRCIAGAQPERHRFPGQAGVGIVPGEQGRLGLPGLRPESLDRAGDGGMQLLSLVGQHPFVGRLLYQGVLERVDGLGDFPAARGEPRVRQPGEAAVECLLAHRRHGHEQLVTELTPDCGTDLGDAAGGRHPVEPRHERVAQGRRNLSFGRIAGVGVADAVVLQVA